MWMRLYIELRRSSREKRLAISGDYYVYLLESEFDVEPRDHLFSFSHTMSGEYSKLWYDAMREEIEFMAKNKV
jgi:hypothetical protein